MCGVLNCREQFEHDAAQSELHHGPNGAEHRDVRSNPSPASNQQAAKASLVVLVGGLGEKLGALGSTKLPGTNLQTVRACISIFRWGSFANGRCGNDFSDQPRAAINQSGIKLNQICSGLECGTGIRSRSNPADANDRE